MPVLARFTDFCDFHGFRQKFQREISGFNLFYLFENFSFPVTQARAQGS